MKSESQLRLEAMAKQGARIRWGHSSAEERVHLIARHYCVVANMCANLVRLVELNREMPSQGNEVAIAHLYNLLERHHEATFGVAPAWAVINLKEK